MDKLLASLIAQGTRSFNPGERLLELCITHHATGMPGYLQNVLGGYVRWKRIVFAGVFFVPSKMRRADRLGWGLEDAQPVMFGLLDVGLVHDA
jgi:hypothetical protein